MLKQIGLATLAATFITGSAAVANAEIGGSGGSGGSSTSAAMQSHWRTTHGGDPFETAPSSNMNAYGYAPEDTDYVPDRTPARPHQGRSNGMKHH
jgi:hypothetical protein